MKQLSLEVRACTACSLVLPRGPRPIFQIAEAARILIASQAPGSKAHESGIPFSDDSGDRLRQWTGLSKDVFYDPESVAILPMGLCYPGRQPGGGDAAPRRECAPLWRERLLEKMPNIRLTLLVGSYAQDYMLGRGKVSERVASFRSYLPTVFPLPHPSWRVRRWAAENPEFEADILPALRDAVVRALCEEK